MKTQDSIKYDLKTKTLYCKDEWNLAHISKLYKLLKKESSIFKNDITIDGKSITKMDSSGAWLLSDGIKSIAKHDIKIDYVNFSKQHQKIFALTENHKDKKSHVPKEHELHWVQKLGKYGIFQVQELFEYINFIGLLFFEALRIIVNPFLWRLNTITSIVNTTGAQALPITLLQ